MVRTPEPSMAATLSSRDPDFDKDLNHDLRCQHATKPSRLEIYHWKPLERARLQLSEYEGTRVHESALQPSLGVRRAGHADDPQDGRCEAHGPLPRLWQRERGSVPDGGGISV